MSLETLKSEAYDTLVQLEALQIKLRQLNQAIASESKKEVVEDGKDT